MGTGIYERTPEWKERNRSTREANGTLQSQTYAAMPSSTKDRIKEAARNCAQEQWADPDFRERVSRSTSEQLKLQWARLTPDERRRKTAIARQGFKRVRGPLGDLTSLEVAVMMALNELDCIYQARKPIDGYIVDFFLPDRNLILECDGLFWHSGDWELRDAVRDGNLRGMGFQVFHLSQEVIRADALEAVRLTLQEHPRG